MGKKYCIYCGTENNSQAKFCTKCGKEMDPKENLLINFLVKRTKDKFKGKAEDSLYEAIKNFLLSHLYGTALTISFISAIVVTASASSSYITEMSNNEMESYLETINGQQYQENINQGVYPQEYNSAIHRLISSYENETLNTELRDAAGNYVAPNPEQYRLPASMGYGGIHELSPSMPTDIEGALKSGTKHRTEFEPENFQREISRKLATDGFTVGECLVDCRFEDNNGEIVTSYEYLLVAVLVDGQWKVAEDVVLEIYTPSPQEVNYDFDTIAALEVASDYYEAILTGGDGSHLLADNLLGYSIQHQLTYDEAMPYHAEGTDTETIYTKLIQTYEFTNNISSVLRGEGYNVMEYLFEQTIYDTNNSYRVMGARDFCITVVEIDGNWYVAEDVLVINKTSENNTPEDIYVDEDAVYEIADTYRAAVFQGEDASYLLMSNDLGYTTEHQLYYDREIPYNSVEGTYSETQHIIVVETERFVNPISYVLRSDGYQVAEFSAVQVIYDENNNSVLAEREYCITCVEIQGQWYIAEDTLLFRVVN